MSTIIDGTTGITTDGLIATSVIVGVEKAQLIKLETAKATTSGTSIDFTSIPTWAKKITVLFNEVSTNGTANLLVQLGTTSGYETTGYLSTTLSGLGTGIPSSTSATNGFVIFTNSSTVNTTGHLTIITLGSNLWVSNGITRQSTTQMTITSGVKTTAATVDRLRITTTSGTDTFDAGSINILIEGSL
jgi:hypothetical protein